MTEASRPLVRLVELSRSPLERAILKTGIEVRTSEVTRVAVLESLGLEPLSTKGRVAAVRSFPIKRGGALLLAAMVVSAAAMAGIPLVRRALQEPSAPPAVQQEAPTTKVAARTVAGPVSVPPRDTDLESVKESVTASEPSPSRPSSHGVGRNALAAELAALDGARAKVRAGEPKSALVLLDAYQREFTRPRLALEAEVLRIDALHRAGQTEAAKRRAAAFVQNHPKGVLTARVRRYLQQ